MPLRHSADQIVVKLEKASVLILDGASSAEAADAIGVSEKTYNRWRKNYLALRSDQLRYVQELELELDRLRLVIDEIERAPVR
ncbi:MAG: helix-turn-helix domain-containing protein [Terricaulis sp.]